MTSANETLRKRVESVVDMALTTVSSLSEMYSGSVLTVTNDPVMSQAKALDADPPEVVDQIQMEDMDSREEVQV